MIFVAFRGIKILSKIDLIALQDIVTERVTVINSKNDITTENIKLESKIFFQCRQCAAKHVVS
jgi:hypothetical protein